MQIHEITSVDTQTSILLNNMPSISKVQAFSPLKITFFFVFSLWQSNCYQLPNILSQSFKTAFSMNLHIKIKCKQPHKLTNIPETFTSSLNGLHSRFEFNIFLFRIEDLSPYNCFMRLKKGKKKLWPRFDPGTFTSKT